MRRKLIGLLIAVVTGLIVLSASASAAREAIPYRWKNCTIVNKRFPHGVGRLGAHDRTRMVPRHELQAQHPPLQRGDEVPPRP